ncbi:hypothetical protein FOL85_09770 [Lactobacillus reuteri]|nr:hypothetical protein [Limosilactobacillus reuteri]NMV56871.1 hypothetical protein [Limosilactobacillus reuteri]NMV65674.1 hypothetical protein [Limosilactobacillus reuteri]
MFKRLIGYTLVFTIILVLISYILDFIFKRNFELYHVFIKALIFSFIYNLFFEFEDKRKNSKK